jgi:hypothetical protein
MLLGLLAFPLTHTVCATFAGLREGWTGSARKHSADAYQTARPETEPQAE